MIEKFVKKPIIIETVKWNGENRKEVSDFCDKVLEEDINTHKLSIRTLEGVIEASVGDYIIKGVTGEFYPCKPDIFAKTYDKIDERYNQKS